MPKKILLADDSVTIRKVVELTFSDTDIRVESVGSGQEALDRMTSVQPDLVLADVGMPEPSGYELCRHIKESARPVPVLLLAGTFEPFDLDRARDCGADGHVVKPFESSVLQQKVESLLFRLAESPPVDPIRPAPVPEQEVEEVFEDLAAADPSEPQPMETTAAAPPEPEALPLTELETTTGELVPESEAMTPGSVPLEVDSTTTTSDLREELPETPSGEGGPDGAGESEPGIPAYATPTDAGEGLRLSAEDIDAIARAVVERISGDTLREIAWEVVPELAEVIIRERIRQLENEIED